MIVSGLGLRYLLVSKHFPSCGLANFHHPHRHWIMAAGYDYLAPSDLLEKWKLELSSVMPVTNRFHYLALEHTDDPQRRPA